MRRLVTSFVLLCLAGILSAQVGSPASATYLGLSAYSYQFADAFSAATNPAALSLQKNGSAGLYGERRFLLKALAGYQLAVALPVKSGAFGLGGSYNGDVLYNETALQLRYGRHLGTRADVGLGFEYLTIHVAGYGSASAVVPAVGFRFHLTEAVQAGISVYNPTGRKLAEGGAERLPSVYRLGLGYDVSTALYLGAEVVKTEDRPVAVNAGLHYVIAEKLVARAGVSSATSVYYFGFGVPLKRLRVDATASIHPYLGITPGLLLIYTVKP